MKKLPLGIQTFSEIINENYVYVDKTENIYNLISSGKYHFLSRPRRFGKSLLISTLKELFSANRTLFKGLWIDSSDYQWTKYPVIHLDFAQIDHATVDELKTDLIDTFNQIAQENMIDISRYKTPGSALKNLVKELSKTRKVVLLVDEYDKPMLDHISDIEKANQMKITIASMYEVIKSLDAHIRAVFVTGVTKFAKTSIFSGMNNLTDISLDKQCSQLLGYTQEELGRYFADHINKLAIKEQKSHSEILNTMKIWYNGYRFSDSLIKAYNPFSILCYLSKQKLTNYWFQSGTPTFLIHLIKKQYIDLEKIPVTELKAEHLETFELNNIPLIPLLFQAGYLTISDYDHKKNRITLNYPNHEVKESFTEYIVASLSDVSPVKIGQATGHLLNALATYDMKSFCATLITLFARIPYTLHIKQESYYHSLFQFLMNLLILETQSEVLTNTGRIDIVINMKNYIYIFELKINKKPQEALQQIIDKKYYESYSIYNKPIILVGLSFVRSENSFAIEYAAKEL